jgi:predicted nucleic acid-binding protein
MRAYVESNFVLELAFEQEEALSCRDILSLCESGRLDLVVPAFALAEPFYALVGREKTRKRVAEDVTLQLREIARGRMASDELVALAGVAAFLVQSLDRERSGLRTALRRVAACARISPLNRETIQRAEALEQQPGMPAPDALVLASVVLHLEASPAASVFLNRNPKDFSNPDIESALGSHGCRLIPSFEQGLGYIQQQLGE